MQEREQHEMFLEKTYSSGVEKWYCSTCGQSLLVIRKPRFMMITQEAADKYVVHRVTEDGLNIESAPITSIDIAQELELETFTADPRLAPWMAWMEKIDFDNLWHHDVL